VDTPVEKGLTLNLDQGPKIDKGKERTNNVPDASRVGSLIYAMSRTRPDIWFGKSLPKQSRVCSLASDQENLSLPTWFE